MKVEAQGQSKATYRRGFWGLSWVGSTWHIKQALREERGASASWAMHLHGDANAIIYAICKPTVVGSTSTGPTHNMKSRIHLLFFPAGRSLCSKKKFTWPCGVGGCFWHDRIYLWWRLGIALFPSTRNKTVQIRSTYYLYSLHIRIWCCPFDFSTSDPCRTRVCLDVSDFYWAWHCFACICKGLAGWRKSTSSLFVFFHETTPRLIIYAVALDCVVSHVNILYIYIYMCMYISVLVNVPWYKLHMHAIIFCFF